MNRTDRVKAHHFFLDMLTQDVRADVTELGPAVWIKAGIEPAAFVAHVDKYYPLSLLEKHMTREAAGRLASQILAEGFLLGQRWEQQRDKDGDL